MTSDKEISAEEQVRVEAELAARLATAPADARSRIYSEMYDEMYTMHLERNPDTLEFGATESMRAFLLRSVDVGSDALEIGCGTGWLATELGNAGNRVIGVDVSERALEIARARPLREGSARFVCASATEVPLADSSVDFAYSVEVLEHLHPDDVPGHLREMYRVLRPQGHYWVVTPNRLSSEGAAERFGVDVDVQADVHLKEWTHRELVAELKTAGFADLRSPVRYQRLKRPPLLPARVFVAAEVVANRFARSHRARSLLGLRSCDLIATKCPN